MPLSKSSQNLNRDLTVSLSGSIGVQNEKCGCNCNKNASNCKTKSFIKVLENGRSKSSTLGWELAVQNEK